MFYRDHLLRICSFYWIHLKVVSVQKCNIEVCVFSFNYILYYNSMCHQFVYMTVLVCLLVIICSLYLYMQVINNPSLCYLFSTNLICFHNIAIRRFSTIYLMLHSQLRHQSVLLVSRCAWLVNVYLMLHSRLRHQSVLLVSQCAWLTNSLYYLLCMFQQNCTVGNGFTTGQMF